MKNINKLLLIIVIMINTGYLFAQTTQMPKWPLNGKEVDFINQQVNNTSASLSTPKFVSNGYYDRDNDMLFHIIDNNLWWGNGNYAGPLFDDTDPIYYPDRMFPEIVVVPTEKPFCSEGSFYAFYCVERNQDPYGKVTCETSDYSLMYSEITTDNNGSGSYSSPTNILTLNRTGICLGVRMGIAATDFLPGTNTRRLYVVYYDDETETSAIKFFNVSPTGVSGPFTVGSFTGKNNPFEACEVEISNDRTKLVFTRNKQYAWAGYTNTNDVTIVHLLSNGYLNTSAGTNGYTNVDLGPSNSRSDCYVGVEFSANQENLYVTRAGVGLYKYELSTGIKTQIYGTDSIANSQLELGSDGFIYGMDGNGQLYTIDEYGAFTTGQYSIGSSGVINNKIYDAAGLITPPRQVYTIPDQIDGCAYDDLFGTPEECCYVDLYTPANSTMQGVQIQINGDDRDIIIQSGNNVTWSPGTGNNSFGGVAEAFMEKGDIIIEPGASLTIEDMIIHFREGYEIQMDDNPSGVGSRLTLDNTTLTVFDECEEDAMWLGIDMNGGWGSQPQLPVATSHQPYLYMKNNSTISYAHKGIDAPAGGYVVAYNSNFINNVVSTSFTSYVDQHSLFKNCNFYWDDDLYDNNLEPSIHVHLWNASGVDMQGCDFINDAVSSIGMSDRGVGIIADISNFSVKGRCANQYCTIFDRNLFSDLYFGIKSNGGNDVLIDRCDFTENQRGAWIISSMALQFTRNDLDLLDNHGSLHDESSFGLFLESSTGYQVEENTFRDGALGLVVYNSGEDENLIYLNDFDNIQNPSEQGTSIVTMGLNCESIAKKVGLQYICNQFENYDYAITITSGSLTTSSGVVSVDNSYIRHEQGWDISPRLLRGADNLFGMLNSPINSEADFYIDDNMDPWNYVYYHHNDNITNFDNYLRYYDFKVHPSMFGTFTTREQECPSNLDSGGTGGGITRNSLDDKEAEQDSLETTYNALLADVNELELVIAAQTATDGNQQTVHNSLMEVSPYLTDTILSSYLMNDNANELSRTSVMIANSPLPSSVKEDVEISNLSSELKYYISQYQTGVNRLENLENKIQMAKAARQYLTDRLQLQYIHNGTEEMQTEWLEYLETKTDLHSKLKLTDLYIKKNQFNDAENLLANIESMLIGTENTEKLKQVRVKQIGLAVRQNPQNGEIPASDLNYLYELAEDYSNKSGGDARAILMASGLESYEPIVILPDPNQEKSAIADNSHENVERPSITPELQSRFDIFPNPVNDKLSVEFVSMSESCDFVVYDMNGKIVQQVTRNEALGYFVLDVSKLKSGNYILYSPQLSEKKQFVVKR